MLFLPLSFSLFPIFYSFFFPQWRLMEPFLFLSSWFQSQLPSIMRFIASYINIFPAYSLVDKSYNVFVPTPYFPSNLQTEIAVDRSKCTDAFQLLRNMVLDNRIPVNLITEVKYNTRIYVVYRFATLKLYMYACMMVGLPLGATAHIKWLKSSKVCVYRIARIFEGLIFAFFVG